MRHTKIKQSVLLLGLILVLALSFSTMAFAQEWEYSIEELGNESPRISEAIPLRNGNIAVTYTTRFPSSTLGSTQPGLLLLSPDGEDLERNSFTKPAFWGYYPHVLSDEDGTTYMLVTYSPDHDSTCANYFMNFDNPPDYSVLGLYKLDEQLSIVESNEFQIPVDTSDAHFTSSIVFGCFNEYCGSIYVFSAFIEEGTVVGGYIKKPSFDYYHSHGNDSIFFFRMGLDGTLISHVGYEMDRQTEPGGGLNWAMVLQGYNIVKVGDSYVCFLNNYPITDYCKETEMDKSYSPGHAYYLDSGFNIVDLKYYNQKNGPEYNYFSYAAYIGSHHNTIYLSSNYLNNPNGGTGCSLYEYGLNNNKTETLPVLRYIERTQSSYDYVALTKGVDIASDNSLYFAYALKDGMNGLTIEHLSPDFDTISTLFYIVDIEGVARNYVQSIEVTEEDDILMTSESLCSDYITWWSTVTKFPAEAFVSIEEAHANGLKTAIAYPNPGKDVLNIRTCLKNAHVEVYDINGRLVHSQALTGGITPIATEDWPVGLYVWKVYTGGPSTGSGTLAESGKWVKE